LLCAAASASLLAVTSAAATSESFVQTVLQQEQFSSADLQALAAGHAVVKTLDTPVRQELAYFGSVYIHAPAARFVQRFGHIEQFERGPGTPQIGRLGVPPAASDVASLTLPDKDLAGLADCRPGSCDLKLPASAMTAFRTGVEWTSPNAPARANDKVRTFVLDLVRDYQANGNAALGVYDDREEAITASREFRALLTSGHPLPLAVPELMTFLNDYPRNRPAGVEDFFYWSMVDFGLKQTLRVSHVMVYALPARPSGVSHVLAIKQLYASHYFRTSLELRFLVEDERRPARDRFHLFSLTRTRIDGTTGLKGSLLRPIVSRRSRNAVRGYLEHMKRQVELNEPASPADAPCAAADRLQVCAGAR
jgi:hypothetical protein